MSKKDKWEPREQPKPVVEEPKAERPAVKKHLQCPICWEGHGGRAGQRKWRSQINGSLHKVCYQCDRCPVQWVAEVRIEEDDGIEFKTTKVVEVRK